jgi:hypothetical protein
MVHHFDTLKFSHDFDHKHADHCLYTKKDIDGSPIIFVLYIDDMLLARNKKIIVDATKGQPKSVFMIKDLGNVKHILGMRISVNRKDVLLFLSQEKYTEKVLNSVLEFLYLQILNL